MQVRLLDGAQGHRDRRHQRQHCIRLARHYPLHFANARGRRVNRFFDKFLGATDLAHGFEFHAYSFQVLAHQVLIWP
ncbi:MAG: hypothetical protein HZT41_04140 [Dechloromonas sp.]|nr:MAG: hypothetical protein HZT41_04140 [Dechloromonas sp.]